MGAAAIPLVAVPEARPASLLGLARPRRAAPAGPLLRPDALGGRALRPLAADPRGSEGGPRRGPGHALDPRMDVDARAPVDHALSRRRPGSRRSGSPGRRCCGRICEEALVGGAMNDERKIVSIDEWRAVHAKMSNDEILAKLAEAQQARGGVRFVDMTGAD